MGGNKANGAGFNPLVDPTAVGFASSRKDNLMTEICGVSKFKKIVEKSKFGC